MSEFKGTPGRWFVDEEGDVGCDARGYLVAGVAGCEPSDEDRANARLIAAAPELLEALQLVMSEQSGGSKSCGHNGFTCTCPYDKAKAAISKVLGQ